MGGDVFVGQFNGILDGRRARREKCVPPKDPAWSFILQIIRCANPTHGVVLVCIGAQEAAENRHIKRGTNTFIANVCDQEGNTFVGRDREYIIEITTYLTGRTNTCRDFPTFRLRVILYKKTGLDFPGDLKLSFSFLLGLNKDCFLLFGLRDIQENAAIANGIVTFVPYERVRTF